MARIFEDISGKKHNLDILLRDYAVTLDLDTNIVTGNIVGYALLLDNEIRIDIDKETYDVLKNTIATI